MYGWKLALEIGPALATGAGNPFVKLSYAGQKQKTQALKHAEDASWKELFCLYV